MIRDCQSPVHCLFCGAYCTARNDAIIDRTVEIMETIAGGLLMLRSEPRKADVPEVLRAPEGDDIPKRFARRRYFGGED